MGIDKKIPEFSREQKAIAVLGQLGAPYGVHGWMKLHSFTEELTDIFNYRPWYLHQQGQWQPIVLEEWKTHGNGLIVKLAGCETPEAARVYTQGEIGIERDLLPSLDNNEYYWTDLIGLTVQNEEGVVFGVIDHLIATGANDVLVIKGERERLVPFILDEIVKKVDVSARSMVVAWDAEF